MQHVGQTSRALKIRFGDHYRSMKKPKRFDSFLYRHFKHTGHTLTKVSVQPVEIITYDENSTPRFKIIKRHETELNRQIVGIPMGTNCAPLVADLFLFCYEREFMTSPWLLGNLRKNLL